VRDPGGSGLIRKNLIVDDEANEDSDDGLQDPNVRRQVGIICLVLGILLTAMLLYQVSQGYVHTRHGVVYRASDPQLFWSLVGLYAVGTLLAFLFVVLVRIGRRTED